MVYGSALFVPLVLYLMMSAFGSKLKYPKIVSIYGYSMFVFIPVSLACSFPNSNIQWGFMGYGALSSTVFLVINFHKVLDKYIKNRKYFAIAFIGFC